MAEQYNNIRIILDRIMRHPLLQDLNLETAVDYTVDFLRIVGVPRMFTEKVDTIEISSYRGKLPCDWYETILVREIESDIKYRYASDTFHLSSNNQEVADYTFMIQGGLIYTSMEEGILEMSYRAIETDDSGFPVIPDNPVFYRALEAYIKKQHFTILFDLGKISPNSFQQAQQDYAWAVGAAEAEYHRLDLSKAESFFNSFKTLVVRDNSYQRGFKDAGIKE